MSHAERRIAEAVIEGSGLTVSQLGLRFDKVAARLLGELRAFAEREMPAGSTVFVTHTAPIRLAAKTAEALKRRMAALAVRDGGDDAGDINGNAVRLRLVRAGSDERLIGFVHNPGVDPSRLLELAERWLRR